MGKPGILFVGSTIKETSGVSDDSYNRFYNEEHLPDLLAYKPKLGNFALRYKNTNPSSERGAYLAIYDVLDIDDLTSEKLEKITEDTRKVNSLGGMDVFDIAEFEPRFYEKIQTFEGQGHESKTGAERGNTVIAVAMDPADGEDADFDEWYRKQHLDMLSMCRGYRRSTRYKRTDGGTPHYLALHEYACEADAVPSDQIAIVTGTEWSKKIIGQAKAFDRDVWTLIAAKGSVESKL